MPTSSPALDRATDEQRTGVLPAGTHPKRTTSEVDSLKAWAHFTWTVASCSGIT
jgi:hypothetical protein